MPLGILIALATASAAPATKHSATPPKAVTIAPKAPPFDPVQMMAMMNKMMDKLFPAGPDPDPARLGLARGSVDVMVPKGAYGQAMTGFMSGMADHVLSMSEADFADIMPADAKKKGKPPSTEPLRLMLAKKDPNFDAKLAAGKAFMATTFTKLGAVVEPKFREGMARSLARRFDPAQLAQINAFLATPTGQAYGREMIGIWFEPEVLRGAMATFPEMMKMMPGIASDAAALDATMKAKSPPPAAAPKG